MVSVLPLSAESGRSVLWEPAVAGLGPQSPPARSVDAGPAAGPRASCPVISLGARPQSFAGQRCAYVPASPQTVR